MGESEFQAEARRVRVMRTTAAGREREWWDGYSRGLRRRHHGAGFGTDAEHELWMALADDVDELRAARGRGYRAGQADHPWPAVELRALLERARLTQRSAARELGVDERTMRRYVAGDLPAPRAIMLALEHLAGLTD